MEQLFQAIRKICPADAWSRGVTLARRGAVHFEDTGSDEIVTRVELQGSPVAPTVSLYPSEAEWDCDCDSPLEACEHVAAAVIAARDGVGAAQQRSSAEGPLAISYRFRRTPEGLSFERGVQGDTFVPIDVPLDAIAAGRFQGPRFAATATDLAVEKALGGQLEGVLTGASLSRLLSALTKVDRVELDAKPVSTSSRELRPRVRVADGDNGGFELRLVPVTDEAEIFRNGAALKDGVLHPIGDVPLSGRERHELQSGKVFAADHVAELVGDVLPSLAKRVTVEIRTDRLPRGVKETPRLSLVSQRREETLYVLPSIVYGEPGRARVLGERFESLGGEVPLRDRDAERELEKRLSRQLGLELGRGVELEGEEAVAFVAGLDTWDGGLEGAGHQHFRRHPPLDPKLRLDGDQMDLEFLSGGERGRRADSATVLKAWRSGASLVPLQQGGYAPLPVDWLELYGEMLADLLAAKSDSEDGELPATAIFDLAALAKELDAPLPPKFAKHRALIEDFTGLPEAELPSDLDATLRNYQRDGIRWLSFLRDAGWGALLADDMGLGKTLQALTVLRGRSLVAAPTSVLANWRAEAATFRPALRVCLYHGPSRNLDSKADLTLTSHALMRQDAEILRQTSWDCFVIDEAQAIKNPESQLARAATSIPAAFRVALTGTPVENRLSDLWSQFHFLNRGLLGGLSDFQERYQKPIEAGERGPAERLRRRIQPFFMRRMKRDVAPELPPRTELTLRAELDPEERRLYDAMRLTARRDLAAQLSTKSQGTVLSALEALLRLRQAACHRALVPGQQAESSSKVEVLLDALTTAASSGNKSLVFSQWTQMLDLMEPHLRASGLDFARLDGSTRDRENVVARFQAASGPPVFLISLKAGGTGLNLTAADHVFLFDPWWNPAVEDQAADRAHRIGQDKPVFVHRLVAADTVEERLLALQEEKRAISSLATGVGGSASLTRDDLLHLLE